MERIGFVGAGAMGQGMAACLAKAGYPVTVMAHRNRGPIEALVELGAQEVQSYAELVKGSDTLILCLPNSQIVGEVVTSMLTDMRPGLRVIDTGTSSPESTRILAQQLAEIGVDLIESPMTGGVVQARNGELGALVGCQPDSFDAVFPLLACMCRTVQHFGPPGSGNSAKLMSNYLVLGMAALVTEVFDQARKNDVDWQKLYEVILCGSGDSGVLRRIVGNALRGDRSGYVFSVGLAHKDIGYYHQFAERQDAVTGLLDAVKQFYDQAVSAGSADSLLSELLVLPESAAEASPVNVK